MIRFVARFVGLWLIAGALVALVIDGAKSIAASSLVLTPVGVAWLDLSPSSLAGAQAFIEKDVEAHLGHWIWDPVILGILWLPVFAVLGILGGLLAYAGRKRRLRPAYA
jgi:hypothetical protein